SATPPAPGRVTEAQPTPRPTEAQPTPRPMEPETSPPKPIVEADKPVDRPTSSDHIKKFRPELVRLKISQSEEPDHCPDEASSVAKRFGEPEKLFSTAVNTPRPPFVSAAAEYRKERVRVILMANQKAIPNVPPFDRWWIVAFEEYRPGEEWEP